MIVITSSFLSVVFIKYESCLFIDTSHEKFLKKKEKHRNENKILLLGNYFMVFFMLRLMSEIRRKDTANICIK